jgi:hypothetical protein
MAFRKQLDVLRPLAPYDWVICWPAILTEIGWQGTHSA